MAIHTAVTVSQQVDQLGRFNHLRSISWILWASLEADCARWALSTFLSVSRMVTQHESLFLSSDVRSWVQCRASFINFLFARNTPFSGLSKGTMLEALTLSQSEALQHSSLQHSAHTQYSVHLSHIARFGAESAKILNTRRASVGKGTSSHS